MDNAQALTSPRCLVIAYSCTEYPIVMPTMDPILVFTQLGLGSLQAGEDFRHSCCYGLAIRLQSFTSIIILDA